MTEQEYVVNSSFLLKRGFAKDWEKLNPLLKQGEIGFILDQNAIKIGDGVTLWNALPIVGDDEFGKFESKIREELEKGWKKPVRFTKSIAIGSAEASGAGSFAMGEYKPFSVKDGCDYGYEEKCEIRRLTEEEREYIYKYTGVYYEYITPQAFTDYFHKNAIYFIDIDVLVHTTDFRYVYMYLKEEDDTEGCNVFNIADEEIIDVNYTGPVVYLYPYEEQHDSYKIRQLTESEQNEILEKTGTIYQYIDLSDNLPEAQNITISRPIVEQTIHVTESEYVHFNDSDDGEFIENYLGTNLPYGDAFNIAEGETIETPFIGFVCEHVNGAGQDYDSLHIQKLTEAAKQAIYNKYGKYYEYIEIHDRIGDGSAPIIDFYNIEKYGNTVSQSEYIESIGGRAFNLIDDTGFKVPYEGELIYSYGSADQYLDLENYEPIAVASGKLAFAQGDKVVAEGDYSHAEGAYAKASGFVSHAEGNGVTASGNNSHAEGCRTTASGSVSHAEGDYTKASGSYSHAEGYNTRATNLYAHAEGQNTTASGQASHAEGSSTRASGARSHAEGFDTTASGDYSHAEGQGAIARGKAQHAQGKYNIEDTENKHAFIIGNGEDANNRSNAFTVDWNGDAKLDGYLDVKGISTSAVTRDLYIGGAKSYNGNNWIPDGYVVVDDTKEYTGPTTKNSAYITTLKAPKAGSYFLALEEGSNYLFKIQVTDSSTHILNVSTTIPEFASGAKYNEQTETFNGFTIHYAHKTKVDASTKAFSDGYVGSRRLNFQKETIFREGSRTVTYPGIQFSTDSAADVKIWWVAGDANRHFSLLDLDRGGRARLGVSGTLELHGEVEAEDSTFRMAHLEVSEEAHIGGSFTAGKNVEIGDSLRVDNDLHVGGYISCGESLDMNGNDIKNAQTITVKGTSTLLGDVKIKNNANRDKYDATKLRDVLDEALDFDFKKRILFNGIELRDLGAQHGSLKSHIDVMRDTSATTLTFSEEEYTFDIGDEPIEIWKDFTLKGINEKPVIINFNYTGTASEFTIFKVMAPDLKISFENLVINSKRVNGGYGRKYIIKCDENAINSNLLLNKIELENSARIDIYQGNSVHFNNSKMTLSNLSGSVKNFYTFNDKKEFYEYYEKLTDYINITNNYQGYYSSIEGANCSATGASHAEGVRTIANPKPWRDQGDPSAIGGAHAEGYETQALGTPSHAEGYRTIAEGAGAHAEGYETYAFGYVSHAEGQGKISVDSGWAWSSYNEGIYKPADSVDDRIKKALAVYIFDKKVSSYCSYKIEDCYIDDSGGRDVVVLKLDKDLDWLTEEQEITFILGGIALGHASHCEGLSTIAASKNQHTQGRYNVKDADDKYAHIVGNGTSGNSCSNAHTLDWDGNAWYSGDVYVGSTSGVNRDEGSKKLATEEFVTNALSGVEHPTPDLTGYATEEFVNTTIQQNAYTLPTATAEAIGGVKVGDTLEISADGALNVKQAETPTELYLMSPGGLKFRLTVSDLGALLVEQVTEETTEPEQSEITE